MKAPRHGASSWKSVEDGAVQTPESRLITRPVSNGVIPSSGVESIHLHRHLRSTARQQDGNLGRARRPDTNPPRGAASGWRRERRVGCLHCRTTRDRQVESASYIRTCEPAQNSKGRGNDRGYGGRSTHGASHTIAPRWNRGARFYRFRRGTWPRWRVGHCLSASTIAPQG